MKVDIVQEVGHPGKDSPGSMKVKIAQDAGHEGKYSPRSRS